jgi:type VI secretion system protein ImpF
VSREERLQPSLLDRLTDEQPGRKGDSRESWGLSLAAIREAVLRDLGWLLNTTCLSTYQDLSDHPETLRSTVNFGIPALSGSSVSRLQAEKLERALHQAILAFEPRLLPSTLKVRVVLDPERMNRSAVRFEIEAELWSEPIPQHLLLRSEIDLETGHAIVEEGGTEGRRA